MCVANEMRDEPTGGPVIEVTARADLRDPPAFHYTNPIAKCHGFRLVMGHIDRCYAQATQQRINSLAQLVPQTRINRRQGLIQQ
jgi:hypothetical protein